MAEGNKERQARFKARQARRGIQHISGWVPFEHYDKIKLEAEREGVTFNEMLTRFISANIASISANEQSISTNAEVNTYSEEVTNIIAKEINARVSANVSANISANEKFTDMLVEKYPKNKLIKCQCPSCGYTVRVTKVWIDKAVPVCPQCKVI